MARASSHIVVTTDMSVQDGKKTVGKTSIWREDKGGFHQGQRVPFEGQSLEDLEEFLEDHRHLPAD